METQAKSQVAPEKTRFFFVMDLEKSQLKNVFSHPTEISVRSTSNFKTANFTIDTHKLPIHNKINLYMQTRKLIINYLHKTNAVAVKAEKNAK